MTEQVNEQEQTEQATAQESQISQKLIEQVRQIPLLSKTIQILEAEVAVHRREKAEMALYIEQQGQESQQLRAENAELSAQLAELAQDCEKSTGE